MPAECCIDMPPHRRSTFIGSPILHLNDIFQTQHLELPPGNSSSHYDDVGWPLLLYRGNTSPRNTIPEGVIDEGSFDTCSSSRQ